MNEAKAIDALTKIFHIETYTGENGNYELSSNSWDLNFNVRIREYTIFIQDGKGAKCSIDSDEDVNTISQEIVAFIGEVIKNESKNYTFEGHSQILAWPYNCNTHYVDYLKTAFDMNAEEDEFDYAKRKRGVTNSRKSVDSSMQGQEKGIQAIMDEYGCSREEAIDIMNSEVTSGCHGKAKKKVKKEIESSDTEIESSTERNANNLNKIFG